MSEAFVLLGEQKGWMKAGVVCVCVGGSISLPITFCENAPTFARCVGVMGWKKLSLRTHSIVFKVIKFSSRNEKQRARLSRFLRRRQVSRLILSVATRGCERKQMFLCEDARGGPTIAEPFCTDLQRNFNVNTLKDFSRCRPRCILRFSHAISFHETHPFVINVVFSNISPSLNLGWYDVTLTARWRKENISMLAWAEECYFRQRKGVLGASGERPVREQFFLICFRKVLFAVPQKRVSDMPLMIETITSASSKQHKRPEEIRQNLKN